MVPTFIDDGNRNHVLEETASAGNTVGETKHETATVRRVASRRVALSPLVW
jgi:hypothetical protein